MSEEGAWEEGGDVWEEIERGGTCWDKDDEESVEEREEEGMGGRGGKEEVCGARESRY